MMAVNMFSNLRTRAIAFYEHHEAKVDIAFFVGGFVFDVFTLSDIDDPLSIAQQIAYLIAIGAFIGYDFLTAAVGAPAPAFLRKVWNYRQLITHFLLGSLLSVYSLFFLKSSSFFSSFVFVALMMGLMIANELKQIQSGKAPIKIALYVICVFSFFSMLFPVLLGFVGVTPFLLALAATGLVLFLAFRWTERKITDRRVLWRELIGPGVGVLALFLVFYFIGWIPPVPLSVQNMGVYHAVEKIDGQYVLAHENPWWRFWRSGDQEFLAEPGDKIYFFAQVFSPGRFDDSVTLHWYYKDPRQGWKSTDRIPMRVTGGRRGGFRGFAIKGNYVPGDWRVSVETTDAREIGRLYFAVTTTETRNPDRVFTKELR